MFNAKVRVVLVAAFVSTLVTTSRASDLGNGDPAFRKHHVQVRLFNLARVPRSDLSGAEREVAEIFAQADMEVHWSEGALDDRASLITDFSTNKASGATCKVANHTPGLSIQLQPHAPRGLGIGTLGFSLPCAAFGIDSTIYIDRCEDVTYETPASFSKVLAYAMAHELGHVLLRSGEHTPTGLMRANWDKAAWLRAALRGIPIDREQARRMRLELSRMESLEIKEASR